MKTGRTPKQKLADATAILSLILPIFFGSFFVQTARIWIDGATATGVVRELIFIEGKGENPDRNLVRYTFTVPGGAYRGQSAVTGKLYKTLAVGGQVEIEYAADDPGNNRVKGDFDPLAIEFLGMIVFGLGLFWYIGPRRWLRTWRGEPDPVLIDPNY
jgi:hypothetical protein